MMGTVETQSMTQKEVSSPLGESTKVVGLEKEKIELNEVLSSVGDQGLCDDGVVQVVETRVSVLKKNVSEVMVDSDKNNEESSLLGMRGSDLNISFEEKLDCEGKVVEAIVLNGDDGLIGVDVKETGEEKKDENSDEKIVNLEVPIVETSEKEKKDESFDGKIVNLEIPIVVDTSEEEKKDENSDEKIVNLEIPIVVENSEEEKKDENSDGKIATLEVPIVETTEEEKNDENSDGKIVNLEIPIIVEKSEEEKKDENSDGKTVTLEVPIAETTEEEKNDESSDGKVVTLEVPIAETNEEEKNNESSDGKIVTLEVPIAETSEEMNVEVEDTSDEKYGFSVGDFVWGKIKSHPWWPGRVYDPSDASDLALKLKQKNRLLVAYFGDGTFAWCHPSQLKTFEDNFDDMVRQSSSKAFNNAVQEAVNEVGKLLDIKMSRSFVAKETTFEFDLPLAKNLGIKEGVRVPESGIEKFSAVVIGAAGLLSQVKQIAETLDLTSILELEILKARLSAFYLSRGGYRLPYYEDPQTVVGLEDMSPDEAVDEGNGKSVVEAPAKGPFEEDYSTPLSSLKSGGLLSGSRSNRSRKQKSIAEIMGEDEDVVHTKDKKRDASDEVVNGTGSEGSEDAVAYKPVRKRKESRLNTDNQNEGQGGEENGESGKGTDEGKSKEQHEKESLRRERKKSKYLSPPFTTSIRELVKGKIETETGDGGLNSPRALKRNGEASLEREFSNSSKRRTKHDEKKTIDPEALQVSSGKVLSDVRDAAISPQIPRETDSLDGFADFILVLRSSLFLEGSLYEVYNKRQSEKKRKKPESVHEMPGKDQNRSNHISPNEDSEPTKKKEKTPRILKEKKAPETKTIKKGGTNEKSSAALLFVSFGPGSSTLPTKSDLITIFSKFGALNEEETEMFRTNYTARVSFLKASDAEKAMNQSEKVNPFESANVTYELEYVSDDGSKSKSSQKKKKAKTPTTTKSSVTLKQCTNEASKLNFIKHELEGLNSMLESSDGKSPDFKTKIESKVKGLLEDVNKMVESNSA